MNIIEKCEICGNDNLIEVLNLGEHPLCDDLIPINSERVCQKYPIEILFCEKCNSAHQKYQPAKNIVFPPEYHYRAHFTQDVLNGMKNLAESCVEKIGNLKGKNILDIGCNDGSLLSFFEKYGSNCIGVEPTNAAVEAKEKGYIIYQDYFTPCLAKKILQDAGHIDIITFTNVFAHIENLPELISALKILINENTTTVIENHYLGSILQQKQFDTFYHEHVRTYSVTSFSRIAEQLDCKIDEVIFPRRYGGNVRVYLKKNTSEKSDDDIKNILEQEKNFCLQFEKMENDIKEWIIFKKSLIESKVNQFGAIPAKAFPGRAAILIHLLGLNEKMISAVYEKSGSQKIGCYVPGTRIPILDEKEFFADEKLMRKPILNLAWHISEEIHNYLRKKCFDGEIIDIVGDEDFKS